MADSGAGGHTAVTPTHCIHYNGILGGDILDKKALAERRCNAGVLYADVKEPSVGRGTRFPCVDSQRGTITCSKRQYPTPEQLAEDEQQIQAYLERLAGVMRGDLKECLHCGTAVEQYREVRPCVYAEPCGHRQYQGRMPKVPRG
jgi:hypothetical protein